MACEEGLVSHSSISIRRLITLPPKRNVQLPSWEAFFLNDPSLGLCHAGVACRELGMFLMDSWGTTI